MDWKTKRQIKHNKRVLEEEQLQIDDYDKKHPEPKRPTKQARPLAMASKAKAKQKVVFWM